MTMHSDVIAPDFKSLTSFVDKNAVQIQISLVEACLFSPSREDSFIFMIPGVIDQILNIEDLFENDSSAATSWDNVIEDLSELEFHALAIRDAELARELSTLKELLEPVLVENEEKFLQTV